MSSSRLFWFDSDSGSDDAVALLLLSSALASSPNCSLIGLSSVFGNVSLSQATDNLMKCADALGLAASIPLFPGAAHSLLRDDVPITWVGHGSDGLGDASNLTITHRNRAEKQHAALALIEAVQRHPHEIEVIAIGPLTNVAIAITLCPRFPALIKSLVVMGGSIINRGNVTSAAEFNFHCDPEAAHIVMSAFDSADEDIRPIVLVPIETTEASAFSWDEFDRLTSHETKNARFLRNIYQAYKVYSVPFLSQRNNTLTARDPATLRSSSNSIYAQLLHPYNDVDAHDTIHISHPHSAHHLVNPCDAFAVACLLDSTIITSSALLWGKVLLEGEARGGCLWDFHFSQSTRRLPSPKVTNGTVDSEKIAPPRHYSNTLVVRRIDHAKMLKLLAQACSISY